MADSTYPLVGVPVTRAERYPHEFGPDADPDGHVATLDITQLEVGALVTIERFATDKRLVWLFVTWLT